MPQGTSAHGCMIMPPTRCPSSTIEPKALLAMIRDILLWRNSRRSRRSIDNKNIAKNQAFILSDPKTRKTYKETYAKTSTLYYGSKPAFDEILERIGEWIDRL